VNAATRCLVRLGADGADTAVDEARAKGKERHDRAKAKGEEAIE
jgi:hypothetical protein